MTATPSSRGKFTYPRAFDGDIIFNSPPLTCFFVREGKFYAEIYHH